jgi:hypothetical protein
MGETDENRRGPARVSGVNNRRKVITPPFQQAPTSSSIPMSPTLSSYMVRVLRLAINYPFHKNRL